MKALFGMVSLVVVLAIVGLLAVKQLRTAAPSISPAATAVPSVPSFAGSGTVREQSQQLQQRVATDVGKALEAGAAARRDADTADK